MQLKNLRIHNFVGLPAADIEFDRPVSLFVGKNNQGKSTIKDAILFALTGKARALTKYKDVRNLSHGDNGMLVELDTVDKETGEINTRRRTIGSVSTNVIESPVLRYCLNPNEFIALLSKERGKILAEVLGGGMQDVVKAAIAEHIGNIDEKLLDEIKSSGVDVLDVDSLKKQVVECRRQYKRDKQALPDKPPILANYDLEQGYDVAPDEKNVGEVGDRIAKGGEYIADVRRNLEIKADLMDLEKSIDKAKKKIKKVPKMPDEVSADDVRMASVYSSIIDKILEVKSSVYKCPVCGEGVDREKFENRNEELEAWLGDYQDKLIEHDRVMTDNHLAEQEIKQLESRRKGLNQKFVKVDYKEGSEDLLKNLNKERDKLQANVANYRRYEMDGKVYKKAGERKSELDELIAECDRIDDALKDGGPVKSAIAAGGRKLPINESLLRLWDMPTLEWSDNGEITLIPEQVNYRVQVEYASASEQYRAGCVMALALAEVSGFGIAALDGFEVLVSDNANAFFDAVQECRINNVLVFHSTDKDYSKVDIPDWLQVFIVDGGKVIPL